MPIKRENVRILVVDDMDDMRMLIRSFLMDEGFSNISEASNGKKAQVLLTNQEFHLVICDWNMPEMTGIELLEIVREQENTAQMPFLMVTAEAEVAKVKEAIAKKVNDFIVKPFKPESLTEKTVRILQKNNVL